MRHSGHLPPALVLASALLMVSCGDREHPGYQYFMPDMVHSVAYDSFAPNPASRDGKTLRRPVPGTIARGQIPLPYGPGPEEAERAGRELTAPFPATPAALARGKQVFETFCTVCHGAAGLGDGPVIPKFPPPPSLLSQRLLDMPQGQMVQVMSHGTALMPPYRGAVSLPDRWRVAHYIRQLQRGREGATP